MTLRFSASVNFLYPQRTPGEVASHAAAAGFAAVEFQVLRAGDAERFAPALRAEGLSVALLNLDIGDFPDGGSGLSGIPRRRADFHAALERGCRNATTLGAKVVHIGPCRVPADTTRERCAGQLIDNLKRARDLLAPSGIRVTVEALNPTEYPDILVGSPEQALEILEQVGLEGVGLQYDIYHAAMSGRDVACDIRTFSQAFAHVQFADCPGRHEPGTGALPLNSYFAALEALDYRNFVGAEYIPSSSLDQSLAWMRN